MILSEHLQTAPVDMRTLAAKLGLELVEKNLPDDISGKIERLDNGYRVTVNAVHGERRKRFTIAHEIAHYILHRDLFDKGIVDDALYRSANMPDAIERQASRYGASLLMPENLVRRFWTTEGPQTREALAEKFVVSVPVAEIRMRELGLTTTAAPPDGTASSPPRSSSP
jgi:Zn-dependent peptidase ImmA (M78 family)